MKRTSISLALFSVIALCTIGINMLNGQQAEITTSIEPQPDIQLEKMKQHMLTSGMIRGLSTKHKKVLEKLQAQNTEMGLGYKYFEYNSFYNHLASNVVNMKPLFISKLVMEEKLEIVEMVSKDTAGIYLNKGSNGNQIEFSTYKEEFPNLKEVILEKYNYLMIYEYGANKDDKNNSVVYEPSEVDELPQMLGGLQNFERSVALELEIPEELDRTMLPESIDFTFVVQGGGNISNIELLTELKGSDKKNRPYYRFFGKVHNEMKKKIADIYPWKKGLKDGKQVPVRVKVSFPTQYMM